MVLILGQQSIRSPEEVTGQSGAVGVTLGVKATKVSQLFSSPVGVAEGSTIWVEEILRVITSIDDPSKVDLDTRWFGGKPYVGTYRVFGTEFAEDGSYDPSREGFINATDITLRYLTPYLVVSAKPGDGMVGSDLVIDPCDFQTRPFGLVVPPAPLPAQVDSIKLVGSSQAFVGRASESFFPIGEGLLRESVEGVGLYINAGCSLVLVRKTIRIAGQVQSTRPEAIRAKACTSQSENCETATEAFFARSQENFRTFSDAIAFYESNAQTQAGLPELLASIVAVELELSAGCKVTYYTAGGLSG